MSGSPERISNAQQPVAAAAGEVLRRIQDRLADPVLTNHDRWVLNQFARFLDGAAPEPDLRAQRNRDSRPLP